jgi:hypothetical protein
MTEDLLVGLVIGMCIGALIGTIVAAMAARAFYLPLSWTDLYQPPVPPAPPLVPRLCWCEACIAARTECPERNQGFT